MSSYSYYKVFPEPPYGVLLFRKSDDMYFTGAERYDFDSESWINGNDQPRPNVIDEWREWIEQNGRHHESLTEDEANKIIAIVKMSKS